MQTELASRYLAKFTPPNRDDKLGISESALNATQPLNGLRHPSADGTSGWFIWGGEEYSDAEDFFRPLHIYHLENDCPAVLPYLGLPAGWRFLIAPGYEDVWFDEGLLAVS